MGKRLSQERHEAFATLGIPDPRLSYPVRRIEVGVGPEEIPMFADYLPGRDLRMEH